MGLGAGRRDLVVLGGSAGALHALRRLVALLPADFPAAVLITVHRAPVAVPAIADMLSRSGPLPARDAIDGEPVQPGVILVAPADHHLLASGGTARVVHGARENRHRPAIDALFRSAAVTYGSRTIAVLLTGLLDDGTVGLAAVKRCGGVALVQDPGDAEFPDMPASALRHVEVDQIVPLDEMVPLLLELTRSTAPETPEVPTDLRAEVLSALGSSPVPGRTAVGELVEMTCPDCGGPLRARREADLHHFRCEVGHAFTDRALIDGQNDAVERSLWVAIRSLEDRARLLDSLAAEGRRTLAGVGDSAERAAESREHAARLRAVLIRGR